MTRKLLLEEIKEGYTLKIYGKHENMYGVIVDGVRFSDNIILSYDILDRAGNVVNYGATYHELDQIFENDYTDSEFYIGYKRVLERYGFMKLRKNFYVKHISEVYDEVFPLYLKLCQARMDNVIKREEKELDSQQITDGLPDSLKQLKGVK